VPLPASEALPGGRRHAALSVVPPDGVRLSQHIEGLVELVVYDLAAIDVELRKERSVEDGAHGFVPALVHGLRLVKQLQRPREHLSACRKLVLRLIEALADALALSTDGIDLGTELVLGPALLRGQVK
jgi:hypothetical protein